ncbi:hypothetical protein QEX65_gp16 [Arthrobacter phage Noely]|uniref:Uncharacterized protein n=1 Tax=Arthrobacter phage Noely TaxID=2419964 RepID=A0A3G2KAH3_9CAUD|nr:hypothetical protein QEX65_gp16 [Arthrobacter phage Noely]AYN55957.1 hypothetical protein PBI_NOELY_16 [Arthrobacter phage Noely]
MASDVDEITLGELGRRMADLSGTVKDGMKELKEEVARRPTAQDLENTRASVLVQVEVVRAGVQAQVDGLAARLEKSEAWGTWGGRLVGAILAAAVLAVVVKPPG